MHMSLDIVRRDLGIGPSEVIEVLRHMRSLGFDEEFREDSEEHGDDVIVLRWRDSFVYDDEFSEGFSIDRATEVAVSMLDVGRGDEGCLECARNSVEHLDFSLLSSVTSSPASPPRHGVPGVNGLSNFERATGYRAPPMRGPVTA